MIIQIKKKLIDDADLIQKILEQLNCTKIHKVRDTFRFGRDIDSSGNGNVINIHTLNYSSYSTNKNGDIITLVQDIKGFSIGESVKWLAQLLDIKSSTAHTEVVLPFGGFFKKYSAVKEQDTTPPLTYPESKLEQYEKCISFSWIKEGISAITQSHFGIGYCHDICGNDRITIPIRDEVGNLCGLIGRLNKPVVEKWEAKYLSLIPVNRSKILYGLFENYNRIVQAKAMMVVEAEKSVLKEIDLEEFRYPCVAVGKHSISPRQVRLIKTMFCKEIIIAFDEGVSMEECKQEAERLKMKNPFHKPIIRIVNMNNPYVEVGSKVSLLDLPRQIIDKILEEYLVTLD